MSASKKTSSQTLQPSLFGINKANRDFSKKKSWGKNQFNTAFPAALASFMGECGLKPVYLTLNSNLEVTHEKIDVDDLFGIDRVSDDLYFAFERDYAPYQTMILGDLPRIDLVTINQVNNKCLRGIEIKLTALPDNTICELDEQAYGSELVIRPDTIVYLALSIANTHSRNDLLDTFGVLGDGVIDWSDEKEMLRHLPSFVAALDTFFVEHLDKQRPLILQTIWKTKGKSAQLAENCLDSFVWSNLGFSRLFIDATKNKLNDGNPSITRQTRTTLWLFKMLFDFAKNGSIDHAWVIDNMTYNTRNDKAFAVSGQITNRYMRSPELTTPRVKKSQLKEIILNHGHKLLSPERRFDAIIFYSPELFEE